MAICNWCNKESQNLHRMCSDCYDLYVRSWLAIFPEHIWSSIEKRAEEKNLNVYKFLKDHLEEWLEGMENVSQEDF